MTATTSRPTDPRPGTATPQRRAAAGTALAAFGLIGVLSACSAEEPADATAGSDTGGSTVESSATSDTSSDSATGDDSSGSVEYKDGEYTATGGYTSPAGAETVEVTLTLDDGVVTAVDVEPQATNPNSVKFQTEFAENVADQVVGVALDDLSVSKVSGSSLTSGGFNDAVAQIKSQAGA